MDRVALVTGGSKGIGYACAERLRCDVGNASKAAIISLTKSMSVELAPFGILVNAVAPGWILTPLSEPFVATMSGDSLGRISPLKRVGQAAEVAAAVSFLCGADATYITGTRVNVDGGLTAMHPAV